MAASSVRGVSLLSAIEKYVAGKPSQWDTRTVLSKLKFHSASQGRILATFAVEGWMCNSLNYLHGGYMASLMDIVSLFGLMSHDKGKLAWTSSINAVFPKAALKGEVITVETVPLHVGSTSLMEVSLKNQAGIDIAKATTVFQCGNEKLIDMGKQVLGFE